MFWIFLKYFRNAADGGGGQKTFLCLLELASSQSERLKYLWNIFCNIFEMQLMMVVNKSVFVLARIWHRTGLNVWNIFEMQLMMVVDKRRFCACSNLASSRSERLKYGSHVWSYAPLQRVKVQTAPLWFFLTFHFQKNFNSSCYGVQVR